jgi:hypothetical protein
MVGLWRYPVIWDRSELNDEFRVEVEDRRDGALRSPPDDRARSAPGVLPPIRDG